MGTKIIQQRKADLSFRALIEIVFFALIFAFIVAPVLWGIWGFFINKPDVTMVKQVDGLKSGINNIGEKEESVPIFLKDSFVIVAYKEYKLCGKDKSCVCLCYSSCDNPKNEVNCRDLEYKITSSCQIKPYIVDKSPAIQNCIIKKEDKSVAITKCCV